MLCKSLEGLTVYDLVRLTGHTRDKGRPSTEPRSRPQIVVEQIRGRVQALLQSISIRDLQIPAPGSPAGSADPTCRSRQARGG